MLLIRSAYGARIRSVGRSLSIPTDPGVSHYTYDVNGHLLGAIDEVGLKSFNYISNAQGQVMLREQAGNGVVQRKRPAIPS